MISVKQKAQFPPDYTENKKKKSASCMNDNYTRNKTPINIRTTYAPKNSASQFHPRDLLRK